MLHVYGNSDLLIIIIGNHVTLNSKCKKDGDLVRIDNHFHSSSLRCFFVGNHGQHYSVFYALLPLQ